MPSVPVLPNLCVSQGAKRERSGSHETVGQPRGCRSRSGRGGLAGWSGVGAILAALAGTLDGRADEADAERYLIYNLGPVSLRPQLEVSETFDSNLFFDEEEPVSDLVSNFRPGLRMVIGDPDENQFTVRYTLDQAIYADWGELDTLSHTVNHRSRLRFSRVVLDAQDQFAITRSLLGGSFSYIRRRIGTTTWNNAWVVGYEATPKLSLGLRSAIDWVDYDAASLAPYHLYDYFAYGGGLRAGYRPTDKLVVFPEVTISQNQRDRNNPRAVEAPVMDLYGISVGAEGDFTPKIIGVVSAGYEMRSYSNGNDIPDGWTANVRLRWLARAKTTLAVGYSHVVTASRDAVGFAYDAHRPTVSVTQQLGTQDRWILNLEGYYQIDEYLSSGQNSTDRKDDLLGLVLAGTYRWKPWLSLTALYSFSSYSDNIEQIPDYAVHRFTVRLATGY